MNTEFSGKTSGGYDILEEITKKDIKLIDRSRYKLERRNNTEVVILGKIRALSTEQQLLVLAFAEALKEPDLPEKAPELYADREVVEALGRKENPIEFIRRVYSDYMAEGLPRSHLRKIDPKLYEALNNWFRMYGESSEINVPTKSDINDDLIKSLISFSSQGSSNLSDTFRRLENFFKAARVRFPG